MSSPSKRLMKAPSTDHVTGLANRRELMRLLGEAISAGGSRLLLLDLDFFKKVNDLYGHVVGDQVLKLVSDILSETCPPMERAARDSAATSSRS